MSDVTLLVKRVYRGTFLRKEGNDIPIFYDSQEIGALCPLSGKKKEIAALTTYQQAVLDYEKTQDEQQYLTTEYEFEHDYVVIKSDWELAYDEYRQGSSYWGEYCHDDHLPQSHQGSFGEPTAISINKLIKIRTHRHKDALAKYATYSNPTDKFLFLYHCLEIDFD